MAGSNLVTQAISELYSTELEEFMQLRRDLAARARAAGDPAAAKAIAALGKPTRSAWVVNKLIRSDPGVAASLGELGDRLRAGEAALDGASIRELSRARRELIDTLVRRALAESGQVSASAALRDEVTDTFSAALADPAVAEQVAAGTLLRAAHWAGFGPGIGTVSGTTHAAAAPTPAAQRHQAAGARVPAEVRVDRERERREAVSAAERAVAEATRAADAAAAAEREIAESVAFMQERLNREQQRLVRARRDARTARVALSRARQALDRLARRPAP